MHDLVNELCYRLNTRAGKWLNSTDRGSLEYTREDCHLDEKVTDALRCADDKIHQLRTAIRWALGEAPDSAGMWFGDEPRDDLGRPYWWRSHLRKISREDDRQAMKD